MPIVHRQMQWRRELDLLSRTGVGLPAIAPPIAALIRQIVGAQTCVIMWVDPTGMPVGVFHEHPNEITQALFMNEYERLFSGEKELNVSWAARQHGQACGRMLNPPSVYFRSNTYNLLMRGDHYRHMLDLRIDLDGVARALVALCRPSGKAFDENDAFTLNSLLPALQKACLKTANALESRDSECSQTGHMMVSSDGQRMHMANEAGIALVRRSRLVGQHIQLMGAMETVPCFVRDLCLQLHSTDQTAVHSTVEVPGGALKCSASWMSVPISLELPLVRQILVALELQQPRATRVVRTICELDLSPLQSKIALYAAGGGRRNGCAKECQVSAEALKKHLRQIYAACRAQEWSPVAVHCADNFLSKYSTPWQSAAPVVPLLLTRICGCLHEPLHSGHGTLIFPDNRWPASPKPLVPRTRSLFLFFRVSKPVSSF